MSTRPIRACIVLSRYPPDFSGQGIQVQRMLPYLAEQGVEVEIVTCWPQSGVPVGPADDAVPVHRILRPGNGPRDTLQRLWRLSRWLRGNLGRFDVLHTIILDWGIYLNLPYVERRGVPLLNEMILLGSDDPATIASYGFGDFKLGRLRRHVDLWVGLTGAFEPSVTGAGIAPERFRVLIGGVDVEQYRPRTDAERQALRQQLGLPEAARIAISVGTLQRRKGFDRVLRAWKASRPEPGRDLLLLVGPASLEEGLRSHHVDAMREIRALAEAPELAPTVRIVGRVDDLHAWMGASDTFVFLSRKEGLGFVILEALATGLPSIVSPLDGIGRELIDDGVTGFVADEPDDPDAVAALLLRLRNASAETAQVARAAREAALQRFSMQARASTLRGLYEELAGAAP